MLWVNLYEETMRELKNNNISEGEILWVVNTSEKTKMKWEDAKELFKTVEYDKSYGGYNIDLSLEVRGDNWRLTRREYDGWEWWNFEREYDIDKFSEEYVRIWEF